MKNKRGHDTHMPVSYEGMSGAVNHIEESIDYEAALNILAEKNDSVSREDVMKEVLKKD